MKGWQAYSAKTEVLLDREQRSRDKTEKCFAADSDGAVPDLLRDHDHADRGARQYY